jgi:hypothetical protein
VPLSFPNTPAAASAAERQRLSGGWKCEKPDSLRSRFDALAVIRLWHLASFDAPTVALVWSLAFAWVAHVRLAAWVLLLQILVVWAVYVGDRLLDARAGLRCWPSKYLDALRERHYFHWRHRRVLAPLAIAAGCAAAAIMLRFMPAGARERDSVLAVASLVYFTHVHAGSARRVFSKEMLVGVLFTVGCALPAWSRADWRSLAVPVAFFAVLAWLNCRAIEAWESHCRIKMGHIAGAIALAGLVLAGGFAACHSRQSALLLAGAVSALLLAALDRFRNRLRSVTLRAAADFVLLTPAFLLAAGWLAPVRLVYR